MLHHFPPLRHVEYIVAGPQFAKLPTDLIQFSDLFGPPGIVDETTISSAELRQIHGCNFLPLLISLPRRRREQSPDQVALALRQRGMVAKHGAMGCIPRHDIQTRINDARRQYPKLIEKLLYGRADRRWRKRLYWRW